MAASMPTEILLKEADGRPVLVSDLGVGKGHGNEVQVCHGRIFRCFVSHHKLVPRTCGDPALGKRHQDARGPRLSLRTVSPRV